MHVKTYFAIGKNPLYVIGYFFHILRMLQVSFHTQDKFSARDFYTASVRQDKTWSCTCTACNCYPIPDSSYSSILIPIASVTRSILKKEALMLVIVKVIVVRDLLTLLWTSEFPVEIWPCRFDTCIKTVWYINTQRGTHIIH